MAADLVRLKVDLIVVSHAPPRIRAAQRATRTIPIVMGGVHVDPVKAGFVVSLARPSGNITGLTNLAWKLHAKQLELLKEAFPRISRAAIIWRPPHQKHAMKEVEAVGQALGIQIQPLVVPGLGLEGLESALSAISREHPDGLLVAFARSYEASPFYARIIEFAVKRRLPTIYAGSGYAKAGGLMSYTADNKDLVRRTASYVDKILKGAKPEDLPVERPTKFDFVINLKTAKKIGVTIPPEVLYRATKVIK
jgi:putative ABC transport system substrate-binding protein